MLRKAAVVAAVLAIILITGCAQKSKITSLDALDGKNFAVPAGTAADQLVLSKYPKAKFTYYNSVADACMAVKTGKSDAVAYDEPILRNFAAKISGIKVLPGFITEDNYGFAVRLGDERLKTAIDEVVAELRATGAYDEMIKRWLPATGEPAAMPSIPLEGTAGVMRFGTSANTEPFSFVDGSQQVVGMDLEIARLVAKKLGMGIEVVSMDFGGMIPALISGKVDMIGSCLTITEERAKSVLFSEPYYRGGIAALVKD